MIETVRCVLAERGLERGCRFIIKANFLDDMRVHMLFNRFSCDSQSILDRERSAGAVRDDANSVHSEQRTPPDILPVRLLMNGLEGAFRHRGTDQTHRALF